MDDPHPGLSRRRFLSGLALLGVTPVWPAVADWWWQPPEPRFTGADFDLAHRLLFDPAESLAKGNAEIHPEIHDVLVIGGGIAGLTVAYRLRDRRVLLLEREAEPGGVSKSET